MTNGYISITIALDTPAGIQTGVTIPGLYKAMLTTHKPILAKIKVKSNESTTNTWITYSISPRSDTANASGIFNGRVANFSVNNDDVIRIVD